MSQNRAFFCLLMYLNIHFITFRKAEPGQLFLLKVQPGKLDYFISDTTIDY
jgi:hypothetical protein